MDGHKISIKDARKMDKLPYLMYPILNELEEAYEKKIKLHSSWENGVSVEEIAELIEKWKIQLHSH